MNLIDKFRNKAKERRADYDRLLEASIAAEAAVYDRCADELEAASVKGWVLSGDMDIEPGIIPFSTINGNDEDDDAALLIVEEADV